MSFGRARCQSVGEIVCCHLNRTDEPANESKRKKNKKTEETNEWKFIFIRFTFDMPKDGCSLMVDEVRVCVRHLANSIIIPNDCYYYYYYYYYCGYFYYRIEIRSPQVCTHEFTIKLRFRNCRQCNCCVSYRNESERKQIVQLHWSWA